MRKTRRFSSIVSAVVLVALFFDVGVHVGVQSDELIEALLDQMWARHHQFGFVGPPPSSYVVFPASGVPNIMSRTGCGPFHRTRLRSCTPWGILAEIREARLSLDVMTS